MIFNLYVLFVGVSVVEKFLEMVVGGISVVFFIFVEDIVFFSISLVFKFLCCKSVF